LFLPDLTVIIKADVVNMTKKLAKSGPKRSLNSLPLIPWDVMFIGYQGLIGC